jgi:hypothetical protein
MSGTNGQGAAQAVHDLGAALWFGGSVMGVAGVNKSGADLSQGIDRIRVASSAWRRFAPAQWAGVAATALAGTQLTRGSAGRLVAQPGFGRTGAAKAAVTVLGAAATGYAAYTGRKVAELAEQAQARGEQVVVKDASIPTEETPAELARWQRHQRVAQYLVPALSGANIVLGSLLVQSYRARATSKGLGRRLLPL